MKDAIQPPVNTSLQQQQTYLHRIGIVRWLPRVTLPQAPQSADWVHDFTWTDDQTLSSIAQPLQEAEKRESVAQTNHETSPKPVAAVLQSVAAALSEDKYKDKSKDKYRENYKENHASLDKHPNKNRGSNLDSNLDSHLDSYPNENLNEIPNKTLKTPNQVKTLSALGQIQATEYALTFTPAGQLLVIDSLPLYNRGLGKTPSYQHLLTAIAFALGRSVQWDASVERHWPIFSGNVASQNSDEAMRSVHRQIQTLLDQYPIDRMLLMGESAAQWVLQQDQPLQAMRGLRFTPKAGIQAIVTHNIASLLKLPQLKAECWADCQSLRDLNTKA